MFLGSALPKRSHLPSPVGPLAEERDLPRALGRRDRGVEHDEGFLRDIGRLWKRREEVAEPLLVDTIEREGDPEIRDLVLVSDRGRGCMEVRAEPAKISDDSLGCQGFEARNRLGRI